MIKQHIRLYGRVQGVGMRWGIERIANQLNITGIVWNNPDGSVELLAQANTKVDFESFIAQIKTNSSSMARIDKMIAEEATFKNYTDFSVVL